MPDPSSDSEIEQPEQKPVGAQVASRELAPRNPLRRFISRVPYTKEFNSRVKERQGQLSKQRLAAYQGLEGIDEELKKKLKFEFVYGAEAISEIDSHVEVAKFYANVAFFTIVFLSSLVGPPLLTKFFPDLVGWGTQGVWWWVLEFVSSLVIGSFAVLIIVVPVHLLVGTNATADKFFNSSGLLAFWGLILSLLACAYLYFLHSGRVAMWTHLNHKLFFYLVIQCGFLMPLVLALAIPVRLLASALKSRKEALFTRAVIVDEFLDLLNSMEKRNYGTAWKELSHRTWVTKRLETVASCLEIHFPRYFTTGVPHMDGWTDRSAAEMANGVRELIKKVVAPNAHTFADFKVRVIEYFIAALKSDWGNFDRIPAEQVSRRQGFRTQAVSALSAMATAAVPILLLFLIKRLGLVAEPLIIYLTVGAYVWAALSLLSRLDPQYAAKLGVLKDLSQALPFGKKAQDD